MGRGPIFDLQSNAGSVTMNPKLSAKSPEGVAKSGQSPHPNHNVAAGMPRMLRKASREARV